MSVPIIINAAVHLLESPLRIVILHFFTHFTGRTCVMSWLGLDIVFSFTLWSSGTGVQECAIDALL